MGNTRKWWAVSIGVHAGVILLAAGVSVAIETRQEERGFVMLVAPRVESKRWTAFNTDEGDGQGSLGREYFVPALPDDFDWSSMAHIPSFGIYDYDDDVCHGPCLGCYCEDCPLGCCHPTTFQLDFMPRRKKTIDNPEFLELNESGERLIEQAYQQQLQKKRLIESIAIRE